MLKRSVIISVFTLVLLGNYSMHKSQADDAQSAFDFQFSSIEGNNMPLSIFEGKVLLVVNTASRCGFTKQYKGLVKLWQRYSERGLVVIAVPSNDFGGQEPGKEEQIKDFCEVTYGVDFPMTEKTVVSGASAHPFYRWANETVGAVGRPRWNFHKYLISRDGQIVKWFSSITAPDSAKIIKAIEEQLVS